MTIFKKFFRFIIDYKYRFDILASRGFFNNWSDEKYLKYKFKMVLGQELNLKNLQTFNEKYLKYLNRNI